MKTEMPRRRGRPRSFDEDQVLAALLETFWDKGFAGASLDQLAAAAGVNRPSLYAAFGDKRAMYLRALAHFEAGLRTQLRTALDPVRPLQEGLLGFFEASIALYLSGDPPRGCLAICTAPSEAVEEPDIKIALRRVVSTLDRAFAARFRIAATRGELAPEIDTGMHAKLAASVVQSLAIRARAGQDRSSLSRLARAGAGVLAPPTRAQLRPGTRDRRSHRAD